MNEFVGFIMSTINSLLSNDLSEKFKKIKEKRTEYKLEEEVINNIECKIKEVFEKEKLIDCLSREKYKFNKKILIYDDGGKKQFIENFFEANKELKYLHTKETEIVISEYIDRVNEIVNEILTPEGKILVSTIKAETEKQSDRILQHIESSNSEINKQLNEIKCMVDSTEKSQNHETKLCCGYGFKSGICNNAVEKNDGEYCKECLEDEYRDKIINLYKIQKYAISKEKKFFVAEQNVGIVQIKGLVFPLYSQKSEASLLEIYQLLDEINQIPYLNRYQFVHIVSNGTVETKQKNLFNKYNANVYTEENIITRIMDFRFYLQSIIDEYKKSELIQHYIEIYEEKTGEPLVNSMASFLNDNQGNALFILGDYGCGKTSRLSQILCKVYTRPPR